MFSNISVNIILIFDLNENSIKKYKHCDTRRQFHDRWGLGD
jgi:hypothetical protein